MLSDNLHSLLHTLKPHSEDGIILKPVAVRRICSDLEALVQDALSMEASAVVPLIKSHSENIVSLTNQRAIRSLEAYGRERGVVLIARPDAGPDDVA